MMILAVVGALALWLLFAWLAAAIAASYLSDRKGYGEKSGLATGLLLSVVGAVVWLIIPARENSSWQRYGMFGSAKRTVDADEQESGGT